LVATCSADSVSTALGGTGGTSSLRVPLRDPLASPLWLGWSGFKLIVIPIVNII
jgi:hypothetical protein|tara:strand:- start:613 stop:774 length:162 start_codon:yes stop_codon:yes gene_type:complete